MDELIDNIKTINDVNDVMGSLGVLVKGYDDNYKKVRDELYAILVYCYKIREKSEDFAPDETKAKIISHLKTVYKNRGLKYTKKRTKVTDELVHLIVQAVFAHSSTSGDSRYQYSLVITHYYKQKKPHADFQVDLEKKRLSGIIKDIQEEKKKSAEDNSNKKSDEEQEDRDNHPNLYDYYKTSDAISDDVLLNIESDEEIALFIAKKSENGYLIVSKASADTDKIDSILRETYVRGHDDMSNKVKDDLENYKEKEA